MIPRTYPSSYDNSNTSRIIIYKLSSVVGLKEWVDYIPVKVVSSPTSINKYDQTGGMLTETLSSVSGLVGFKDYLPVYVDSSKTLAWSTNSNGYIPIVEESGGIWTPADLPDLALWLDADDAGTITLNGSNVSQWDDKSGNGRNVSQASAAAQPAYTAGTVTFDGVDDTLVAATSILTDDFSGELTMMSVSSFVAGESGYLYGAVDTTGTAFYQNMGTTLGLANSLSGANLNQAAHGFTLPSMNIAGAVYNNTVVDYSFNGNIVNTTAAYNFGAPTVEFTLGNRRLGTAAATYWAGSHHEIIVTNTALSTADRQKLEGYLAWKWGLEGNLPAGHPYKSTPPTV